MFKFHMLECNLYYSAIERLVYILSRLDSNLDVASRVNAEVVTKPELATLGDLFSYMNQASAKVLYSQYLIHPIR